ncbi:hypothetical protein E3Q00_02126 [Wallemia mellicola]|nr:hypothetical protein E3Q00_02126 [Wallemia mellicola]
MTAILGKFMGRGIDIASNTAKFAYNQIIQSDEQEQEQQPLAENSSVHYGSFDAASASASRTDTIKANNNKIAHSNVHTDEAPSGSANDVDFSHRPAIAIDESEELMNVKYSTLLWLHAVTPATLIIHFTIIITLILKEFPKSEDPFSLKIHFNVIYIAIASWVLANALKQPIFRLINDIIPSNTSKDLVNVLVTIAHTLLQDLVRWQSLLIAVPALKEVKGDHNDQSFTSLSWFIVGWLGVLLGVSTYQQFINLSLYKDFLPTDKTLLPMTSDLSDYSTETASTSSQDQTNLGSQLTLLENIRDRRTLSDLYGQPFPNIPLPGLLFPLWRLDTLLLSSGIMLILGAYPIWSSYFFVTLINLSISLMWQLLLPKLGLGGLTWISFMFATITFFVGLNQFGIV